MRVRRRRSRTGLALACGLAALAAVWAGLARAEPSVTVEFQTLAEKGADRYRLLEAVIAAFEDEHPNINVRLVGERLKLDYVMQSIIARRSADVIEVRATELPFLVNRGALADLTAETGELAHQCISRAWGLCVIDKHAYGVPWAAVPTLLLYNKQAYRAAGLDPEKPPGTWAELIVAAKRLNDAKLTHTVDGREERTYGFALAGGNAVDLGRHFATFLAQLERPLLFVDAEGDWRFQIDTEQGRHATLFLRILRNVAPPDCVVTDDAGALKQFRDGKAVMVFATPAGLTCDRPPDIEVGVAPMPAPAEGITRNDVVFLYASVPASLRDRRRAAAVEFATFLAGPQAQRIVARGLDDCVPVISIRQDLLEDGAYRDRPRLRAFAEALDHSTPTHPWLAWEGKCYKDWLGWIHLSLVASDIYTIDEVVTVAQDKGNQALSCVYTRIGHPSLTMRLGMFTLAAVVFFSVAYVVARH